MFQPLMYGQLNISDKILTQQPSELEYLVQKLLQYNSQGLTLGGDRAFDPKL